MKKITTLCGKVFFIAGIFLAFILCNMQLGIAQELTYADVHASADSLQPVQDKLSDSLTLNEQMPSFPGGEYEMMKYLYSHTRYPDEAVKNKIEGTVIVQFIVCKDGKLRDIRTVGEKIGWHLDLEAMRIVNGMPDWIPGRHNGEPVNIIYRLPVKFVLSAGSGSVPYDARDFERQIGSFLMGRLIH